jgi:hypothetical protein
MFRKRGGSSQAQQRWPFCGSILTRVGCDRATPWVGEGCPLSATRRSKSEIVSRKAAIALIGTSLASQRDCLLDSTFSLLVSTRAFTMRRINA